MAHSVSDLIEALGGTAAYAGVIGSKYSTASEQKRSGRIPVQYWPPIIAAARLKGEVLDWVTSETLMEMHAQQSEAAQ